MSRLPWTVRLLVLPLNGALSVERFLNRPSAPTGVPPAQLTYFVTEDGRLRKASGDAPT